MNIIYTVNSKKQIIYYCGYSYIRPKNKHVCNCRHCIINTKELRYKFDTERDKAAIIADDNEAYRLMSEFNKPQQIVVPLWARGYHFCKHYITTNCPIPKIMQNFVEYYSL
jgi:ribosomal protein L40E